MNIDSMTADDLREFESFLINECAISLNTICTNMTLLRTVCNWVRKQGVTTNDPFFGYEMPKALYGTPYFLTIQERDHRTCRVSGHVHVPVHGRLPSW